MSAIVNTATWNVSQTSPKGQERAPEELQKAKTSEKNKLGKKRSMTSVNLNKNYKLIKKKIKKYDCGLLTDRRTLSTVLNKRPTHLGSYLPNGSSQETKLLIVVLRYKNNNVFMQILSNLCYIQMFYRYHISSTF